jgi:outer membrane protein assembly factor BamB
MKAFTLMAALSAGSILTPSRTAAVSIAWPQFRGPNGSGVALNDQPAPVTFGPNQNRVWQTELPPGHSSPCIWGDRIFLTGFDSGTKKIETLCLDRHNGNILWRKSAPEMEVDHALHQFNSPAASTPATDGERVYLYLGSYGALAYDFAGNQLWTRPLPTPPTQYGSASSPIVFGSRIILQRDGNSTNSEVLALDAKTGQTIWTAPRPLNQESYSTPIVWSHDGLDELVTVGHGRVDAYELRDGSPRWWTPGLTVQPISVAVVGDGLLFASSMMTGSAVEKIDMPDWPELLKLYDKNGDGRLARDEVPETAALQLRKEVTQGTPGNMLPYRKLFFEFFDVNRDGIFTQDEWEVMQGFVKQNENNVSAIRPGGSGNIQASHIAWKGTRGISEMPSPLFYRDRLYFVKDGGLLTVYEPKSGQLVLDRERLGATGQFVASPVAAGGLIYAASVPGKVVVFKAGDTLEVLARNDLGEHITATPAIVEGQIYIRTAQHLWAFARR